MATQQLLPPIIIALAGLATGALALASVSAFESGLERLIMFIRRYHEWLPHVPVNPLTLLTTSRARIERLGAAAEQTTNFSYPLVLRYKEISFWLLLPIIYLLAQRAPTEQVIIFSGLGITLAWSWPELYLKRTAARIKAELERTLTHIIDLLRLYVSAGLNLENALRKVSEQTAGFWGPHLRRIIYRLDVGRDFDQALADSAAQITLPDFNRFLASLRQARVLGASLGNTLSVQSYLLRARRRQQAETRAREASVKIALPLVLCIFPALLIIYLLPAILRLLQTL